MRNRICFMVAIVAAMFLVACDEPSAETTEATAGEPDTSAAEIPETTEAAPETTKVTGGEPGEPVTTALTVTVREPIAVGGLPRLATDDEYVWATSGEDDAIVRIDPAVRDVTGGLQGLGSPMDVAVLDGHVWVIAESWLEIDREDVDIVASMPALAESYHLAAGFGSLWAVSGDVDPVASSTTAPGASSDTNIIRIDPQERAVTARIPIEGVCQASGFGQTPAVIQLDVFDDAVWALTFCDGDSGYVSVYRIDPGTNSSRMVAVVAGENDRGIAAQAMTVVDGTPWLVAFDIEIEGDLPPPGWLVRIDADSGTFEEVAELGRWPRGVAYANGFLWVTDCADATVTQVDPNTGDVVGDPILIGTPAPEDIEEAEEFSCPADVIAYGNTLWVCTLMDGTIIPIELGN